MGKDERHGVPEEEGGVEARRGRGPQLQMAPYCQARVC